MIIIMMIMSIYNVDDGAVVVDDDDNDNTTLMVSSPSHSSEHPCIRACLGMTGILLIVTVMTLFENRYLE